MARLAYKLREKIQLYVDGRFGDSSDEKEFPVYNPATNEVIANASKGTADDAKAAIDAAEEAFDQWSETPPPQRAEILYRVGEMIREQREELARILTIEEGKAFIESLGEIDEGYDTVMYLAGEGRRTWSNVTTSEQSNKFAMVIRRPVGIVVAITPWNFPFSIPIWKIPPALVAGNTVVFKPASNTPLIALKIIQMFIKAGIPRGVLNMVTGPGAIVGEALINDPRVKLVTFTGETTTGRHLAEVNARFLRRQVLELGGKNPLIVATDAELDVTVKAALFAAFSNAGQKCTAAARIIVEQPLLAKFTKYLVAGAENLIVGNGMRAGVEVGPLNSKSQLEKTRKYVKIGEEEDAKLLTGGYEYHDKERSKGNFYPPTIFAEVSNDMRIAQEEIFGPVTTIIPAENIDDAIEIANDTRYGLTSAIYTKDIRSAFKAIKHLQSGIGYVNQGPTAAEVHLPFGGIKDSGFGREAGEVAIDNYTEKKAVYIDYSYAARPWYFPWKD